MDDRPRGTGDNPYHEGELRVQARAGERAGAARSGRVIKEAIPDAALGFISQQPMIAVGSRGDDDRVWASLLFGPPGFIEAPRPETLEIDLHRAIGHPDDPFWSNIGENRPVGTLLIELETRRRLRVNGPVERSDGRLTVHVEQAYPNCPKYIQRRHVPDLEDAGMKPASAVRNDELTEEHREWISGADTFFVASAHPERGLDASHRGGDPGFVQVLDRRTLRIPDYPGNSMFNTFGNLMVEPAAGLVFPDFDGDRLLQLTGRAEVRWNLDDPERETGGTGRFWDFTLEETLTLHLPLRSVWEFLDSSPHNP